MSALLRRTKLLGLVFLALLLVGVYLTYGLFTKKFTTYDEVTLQTSTIGLQLPTRADVKVRGVIVGEVLDAEATTDGAQLTLGLFTDDPDRAGIPANVTGSIVPKTLFGEKYVALEIPEQPEGELLAGATITRTQVSVEVEQVLSDLYPLLRTVQPAKLNSTLNAIATALEGRGDAIGDNLERLDAYLKKINPQIPLLVDDLRLASQVSDTYVEVLPQVASILQDTITTTTTLEDRSAKLAQLFDDVTAFSDTARVFLDTNESNLIRLGQVSTQTLDVLARYSTEFPCLLGGVVNAGRTQAEAFRNFTLHINLETLPNQPRGYDEGDKPVFGEDRGPSCLDLPNPPWSQDNPLRRVPDLDDGITRPTGKGTQRVATDYPGDSDSPYEQTTVGTPYESDLLDAALAPALGTTSDQVGDLAALLVGPMARGATLSYGEDGP